MVFSTLFHPPILFFLLGVIASVCKSNLEIPEQIKKFLSIYLLMVIGLNGGYELKITGITHSVVFFFAICILFSILVPIIAYGVLRRRENVADSVLIASCYGSVSAVTFITASGFLVDNSIHFDGYLAAALAIMEFPAIMIGLLFYKVFSPSEFRYIDLVKDILKRTLLDQSILLLVGSIIIGYICGIDGKEELHSFTSDIFKGMLCLYLLDVGLQSGREIPKIVSSSIYLILFALVVPIINGCIGILVSHYLFHFNVGNSLLVVMLFASASYIAVPASMRISIPEANIGVSVTMTLLVTFVFNVLFAMPIYYSILNYLNQ